MKNRYLLAFVTLVLSLCSCNKVSDWLEKQDTGDLQYDDIWADYNYVEGWLNNCFMGLPGCGWWCAGGEPHLSGKACVSGLKRCGLSVPRH